ncbi:hypothetical protein JTE90_024214 [Oedothorax gibbosus]|uniref:Homeobox domain-containing protein n=1 Tax=Oedothorax gibbosus TaxID=931172 RepID=A0AAV6U7Y8_9ARAC|nr:hypothetical protein JTE90_024214 [Oedothorax gibbosus]
MDFQEMSCLQSTPSPEKNGAEKRRVRTIYNQYQLSILELEFINSQYLVAEKRRQLARELGLAEENVKVWFQNRRQKSRNGLISTGATKRTKKIHQEAADSTVQSPENGPSTSRRSSDDQGSSRTSNESYASLDADGEFRQDESQTMSSAAGSSSLVYGINGRPSIDSHQSMSRNRIFSRMRARLRFNTYHFKGVNSVPVQRPSPQPPIVQTYPSANIARVPLQNSAAGVTYNRYGFNHAQSNGQMIPQPHQFNGYHMMPNTKISQNYPIPNQQIFSNGPTQFSGMQQQSQQQTIGNRRMMKQAQWSNPSPYNRRQQMAQYHKSNYVQQNPNQMLFQERKPILNNLHFNNHLEHQPYKYNTEMYSPYNISNGNYPRSCSLSNDPTISSSINNNSPISYSKSSCQFDNQPSRPSSSAYCASFPSGYSTQNKISEIPINGIGAELNGMQYHNANYSRKYSSSTSFTSPATLTNEFHRTGQVPFMPQNMHQSYPSTTTNNYNPSETSLPGLYDQVPFIKEELIEHSSNASTADTCSPMSSIENLGEELIPLEHIDSVAFSNNAPFIESSNFTETGNGPMSNNQPSIPTSLFDNPTNATGKMLAGSGELFDNNNTCVNNNIQSSCPTSSYSLTASSQAANLGQTSALPNVYNNFSSFSNINPSVGQFVNTPSVNPTNTMLHFSNGPRTFPANFQATSTGQNELDYNFQSCSNAYSNPVMHQVTDTPAVNFPTTTNILGDSKAYLQATLQESGDGDEDMAQLLKHVIDIETCST